VMDWSLPVIEVIHKGKLPKANEQHKPTTQQPKQSESKAGKEEKVKPASSSLTSSAATQKATSGASPSSSGSGNVLGAEGVSSSAMNNNNVALGVFTTAHARLHLYRALEQLGDQVLYFDTDSVFFKNDKKCADHKQLTDQGPFMGQWKSELDHSDEYITRFAAGGPKNYCYETNRGKKVAKKKGFALNTLDIAGTLNADVMRRIIVSGAQAQAQPQAQKAQPTSKQGKESKESKKAAVEDTEMPQAGSPDAPLQQQPAAKLQQQSTDDDAKSVQYKMTRIRRDRKRKRMAAVETQMTYRFIYDKAVIMPDLSTRPFGHRDVADVAECSEPAAKRRKLN
jgi:hypothetical protein